MPPLAILAASQNTLGTALCEQFARLGYRVVLPCLAAVPDFPASALPDQPEGQQGRQRAEPGHPILKVGPPPAATAPLWLEQMEARHGPIAVLVYQPATGNAFLSEEALSPLIAPLHAAMCQRQQGRLLLVAPPDASVAQQAEWLRLMRQLAQDALGQGVTVNLITGSSRPSFPDKSLPEPAAASDAAHLSQAQEIAGLAAYLASEEAGAVSGAHFHIHGPGPASSPAAPVQ